MNYKTLINKSYLADLLLLKKILSTLAQERQNILTKEDQVKLESRHKELLTKIFNEEYSLKRILKNQRLYVEDLLRNSQELDLFVFVLNNEIDILIDLYFKAYEDYNVLYTAFKNKAKKYNQKYAIFKLWNNSDTKYLFVESFQFLDKINLNNNFSIIGEDLTLKVLNQTKIKVKSVSYLSESRGNPGNSDLEVSWQNTSIENILNKKENKWFEFEKLDVGPVRLTVKCIFDKPEILNSIYIDAFNFGQNASVLEDVIFNTERGAISIKELTTREFSSFEIKNTNVFEKTFVPVKASSVIFTLSQNEGYPIKYAVSGITQSRIRYALAIKEIGFYRNEFAEEAEIQSRDIELVSGLYGCLTSLNIFPKSNQLYSNNLDIELNDKTIDVKNHINEKEWLLTGEDEKFSWKLFFKRNNEFIKLASSFTEENQTKQGFATFAWNGLMSPQKRILSNESIVEDSLFVVQPKVLRRGNKLQRVVVHKTKSGVNSFEAPIDLSNIDIDKVHVYRNGQELTYNEDNIDLEMKEWSLSEDLQEIIIGQEYKDNETIEALIDPEEGSFIYKNNLYIHYMEYPFDIDKELIEVKSLQSNPSAKSLILPKGKKIISLKEKNLIDDSIKLTLENGDSWTEVQNKEDIYTTSQSYFISKTEGILWLSEELDESVAHISFNALAHKELGSKNFDIYYENNIPVGISIKPENFIANDCTDTISLNRKKIIDPISGIWGERAVRVTESATTKPLTHKKIIPGTLSVSDDLFTYSNPEEIKFIDGKSEFFGLSFIKDEKVPSITATSNVVSFVLSAGAMVYLDLGVHFDNDLFLNLVESIEDINSSGDYYIDDFGNVSFYLTVGSTIDEDISISYYYKNRNFNSRNKYSVDYNNGILYSYSNMQANATITYKVCSYKISYDIVNVLNAYEYSDKVLTILPYKLKSFNKLIKAYWKEYISTGNLKDYEKYFSPIISNINFRFF